MPLDDLSRDLADGPEGAGFVPFTPDEGLQPLAPGLSAASSCQGLGGAVCLSDRKMLAAHNGTNLAVEQTKCRCPKEATK